MLWKQSFVNANNGRDNDDSEPLYQKAPKKYEFPESSSYTIAAEPNIKYNNLLLKNKSHISIIIGN